MQYVLRSSRFSFFRRSRSCHASSSSSRMRFWATGLRWQTSTMEKARLNAHGCFQDRKPAMAFSESMEGVLIYGGVMHGERRTVSSLASPEEHGRRCGLGDSELRAELPGKLLEWQGRVRRRACLGFRSLHRVARTVWLIGRQFCAVFKRRWADSSTGFQTTTGFYNRLILLIRQRFEERHHTFSNLRILSRFAGSISPHFRRCLALFTAHERV
jgi:hypothetical protein